MAGSGSCSFSAQSQAFVFYYVRLLLPLCFAAIPFGWSCGSDKTKQLGYKNGGLPNEDRGGGGTGHKGANVRKCKSCTPELILTCLLVSHFTSCVPLTRYLLHAEQAYGPILAHMGPGKKRTVDHIQHHSSACEYQSENIGMHGRDSCTFLNAGPAPVRPMRA